ncbi:hypothetical protein ACGFIW_14650 [Micromonospora sp. NPDC048935]|uniref:hypothetical protein n=1 Tax=Micromonospora sp. NPDC048935 TaxID=3364262 RepID=UPI00371322F2
MLWCAHPRIIAHPRAIRPPRPTSPTTGRHGPRTGRLRYAGALADPAARAEIREDQDRITAIYNQINPEKLADLPPLGDDDRWPPRW